MPGSRFRRNFAPVLAALGLLALLGVAWVAWGVHGTRLATGALRAGFRRGAAVWDFAVPEVPFLVLELDRTRSGHRCLVATLVHGVLTVVRPGKAHARRPTGTLYSLLRESVVHGTCDELRVAVYASRMPYAGRIAVRFGAEGRVTGVSEPRYGH